MKKLDIIKSICSNKNYYLTGSEALRYQGLLNRDTKDIDIVTDNNAKAVEDFILDLFPDSKLLGKGIGEYPFIIFRISGIIVELIIDRVSQASYIKIDNTFIKAIKPEVNWKIKKLFNKAKYLRDLQCVN